ncbi:MAG: amidohydrolase [Gemmatimonadota bacterium]|nr:amidohydrolase [Gemmatimonadota bacterium]
MTRGLSALLIVMAVSEARGQEAPPPIIDVHLHAQSATSQGPPPLALCLPMTGWPAVQRGASWPARFMEAQKEPDCPDPIWSPESDVELLERTLEIMERRNVIGITSGSQLQVWQGRAPDRIIPGILFNGGPGSPSVDALRAQFAEGQVRVLSEVTIQYRGLEPGDPSFEPYLALAEELDIPVGIHIGTGPPGAPYLGFSMYRARLHSPLILEEVLIKHPNLRLYVMHAGWPMLDDLLALLWAHPQVHVGVGVINWGLPRAEFHRYLRRIVEAGFGKRVMFGSDQMVWPEALEFAIQSVETAPFLSEDQKRDILYHNAARFLGLSDDEIANHHEGR